MRCSASEIPKIKLKIYWKLFVLIGSYTMHCVVKYIYLSAFLPDYSLWLDRLSSEVLMPGRGIEFMPIS